VQKRLTVVHHLSVLSTSFLGAPMLQAQVPATSPLPSVSTPSPSAPVEIGGEYQLNITHSNDGLNDKERKSQYDTTAFNLRGVKLAFKGKFTENISWFLLYKAKEGELERFFLTHKPSEELTLTLGKQKIKVYGMYRKLSSSVTSPVTAAYLDPNPLKDRTSFEIAYKLAGTVSLQLVEDYSQCTAVNTCTSYNRGSNTGIVTNSKETQTTQKQPAVAFEWLGSFGAVTPLIQYAAYDLGKSRTASAGLRFKNDVFDTYVDYTVDTRHAKGPDPEDPGRSLNQKSVYRGGVVYAEAKVARYTPFVQGSYFHTKPYEKEGLSEKDQSALRSNSQGKLDKNERSVVVGTHYDGWGAFYRPYLAVSYATGLFVDFEDETQQKRLARVDAAFGVIGKF